MSNPSATTRRIACLGFDWRAEISLKETLTLLRGKTRDSWQYTDELTADVVVYETSNTLAQAMVRRCAAAGTSRVFFPSNSDDETVLTLRYPFGASRLIACLDSASAQLPGTASTHQRADTPSLSQRLDDALQRPGTLAVAIHAQGQQGWLKLPERELHWSQPMSVDDIAGLLSGDVDVQALGPEDGASLRRLEASARHRVPVEGLLWAVGVTRSRGSLLQRIDVTRSYKLRRWPDFGAIGRRSLDIRCASLLTQRELVPTHMAMMTGIPLSVLGSFLNACALVGLLEQGAELAPATSAPAPSAGDSTFGGVLRRIRNALMLGQ